MPEELTKTDDPGSLQPDCSAAVKWSKNEPEQEGWWWVERNGSSCVVRVLRQRARGNLLCAWLPTFREWMRCDEITNDVILCRWGGPIPLPSEPPNEKLTDAAVSDAGKHK